MEYGRKCATGSSTLLTATLAAGLTLRNLKRLCSKNLIDKRAIACSVLIPGDFRVGFAQESTHLIKVQSTPLNQKSRPRLIPPKSPAHVALDVHAFGQDCANVLCDLTIPELWNVLRWFCCGCCGYWRWCGCWLLVLL
jgi:hypothetical protein